MRIPNRWQRFITIWVIIAFMSPSFVMAQPASDLGLAGKNPLVNYSFARPGDLTIYVNIWGAIAAPGRYEVPTNTTLLDLLSLTGGPKPGVKMNKIRIIRIVETNPEVRRVEFTVNLEDITKIKDRDIELYPGDTIILEETSWQRTRQVISSISTVVLFATAIINLINLSNK
ncbi:MAG: hypothetical protein D6675_09275 [Gemmatimonadetes bacterium]|nr:MAG: hypothetical protein D6675_09275 [Gemmatimonadota bacterium]